MKIVRVEAIQIARKTAAFARRTKSNFAQSSDFGEDQRNLRRLGQIDAVVAILFEKRLRRHRIDFAFQIIGRHRFRHRRRYRGGGCARFAPPSQQFRSQPQILNRLGVRRHGFQTRGFNRRTHQNFHRFSPFIQ
jgi:hypothetical protein